MTSSASRCQSCGWIASPGGIGRASCRGRGEISVVAVSLKKKKKSENRQRPSSDGQNYRDTRQLSDDKCMKRRIRTTSAYEYSKVLTGTIRERGPRPRCVVK